MTPDQFDHLAMKELELVWGTDRILRVNVDGICVMRVRVGPTCETRQRGEGVVFAEAMVHSQ